MCPLMDYDLQLCIAKIFFSCCEFLCKDLAKLRLVSKSFSSIVTFDKLEKKVLYEKLSSFNHQRLINIHRTASNWELFNIPMNHLNMMLPIQLSSICPFTKLGA
jgi:hypothetical protein